MVAGAHLIVRATAHGYEVPPYGTQWTSGEPDSRIRFTIRETVKGPDVGAQIVLPGYLSERDDFNDHAAPYGFVRPNGRSGSCYANTYREGADFLLVMKQQDGHFTVNWYPLGPVNEQLHGPEDPWLLWVRTQVKPGNALANTRLHPTAAAEWRMRVDSRWEAAAGEPPR